MKTYTIAIEETVVDTFEIEAVDSNEAMKIAEDLYIRGKIVLEPGNVVSKRMALLQDSCVANEWVEF